jgi:hypothetical protein
MRYPARNPTSQGQLRFPTVTAANVSNALWVSASAPLYSERALSYQCGSHTLLYNVYVVQCIYT